MNLSGDHERYCQGRFLHLRNPDMRPAFTATRFVKRLKTYQSSEEREKLQRYFKT